MIVSKMRRSLAQGYPSQHAACVSPLALPQISAVPLQHFKWGDSHGNKPTVTLHGPEDSTTQVTTLQAQVPVLKSLPLKEGAHSFIEHQLLQLSSYDLTHDLMCELPSLPEWAGVLDLSKCQWPLAHTEYSALAQHVPSSYVAWVLPGTHDTPLVQSIIQGLEQHRAALGLKPMALLLSGYEHDPYKPSEHVLLFSEQEHKSGVQVNGVEKHWQWVDRTVRFLPWLK